MDGTGYNVTGLPLCITITLQQDFQWSLYILYCSYWKIFSKLR